MKYEYLVKEVDTAPSDFSVQDMLNYWGEQGWELIDFDPEIHGYARAIFKREASEPVPLA